MEEKMKKIIIGIVIASVFIAGGAGLYIIFKSGQNPTVDPKYNAAKNAKIDPKLKYGPINACDVLTEEIAKSLLGDKLNKGSTPVGSVTTASIGVSNCGFLKQEVATGSSEPKISGASLLVQFAKDATGAALNKSQFESGILSSDVKKISDVGDSAFYNPQYRQLHVLKGSNWYIVTYYKNSMLNSSLESDLELAKKMQFK